MAPLSDTQTRPSSGVEADHGQVRVVLAVRVPGGDHRVPVFVDPRAILIDAEGPVDAGMNLLVLGLIAEHPLLAAGGHVAGEVGVVAG